MDENDDDGNYIGDNPKYRNDIEEESDTEDGDEEEKQYSNINTDKRAKL